MERAAAIDQTRNLGIMAHIDAGKTTTTERILYYTGVSSRMGEVDHGSAVMDWMQQEQERGITITAASTSFAWKGCYCNLIDLPGHVDFTVEVERSLRVLDGAVAIFCAVSGVEPQSETVWRQADRYAIPRIAFINKCDRVGADPAGVAEQIRNRLRANPIVLQLPHKLEEEFDGIVDLVHFRSHVWDEASLGRQYEDIAVPEDVREEALLARGIMLEALAEVDDSVMEKYLAESEITPAEIKQALRRATLAMRAVPVVVGSAFRNKGVQLLLDAIVDYLPSPVDLPPAAGVDPNTGARVVRAADPDAPVSALAFKVMNDPVVGQLTYLRVYSGTLRSGDQLLNATKGKNERLGRLVKMHANHREEIREIHPGDIGAAVGLRATTTGDTLADAAAPVVLESMQFPEPVVSVTLEPETDEDEGRLTEALARLAAEDPTFRVSVDPDSSQTVVAGMGELHLEILADRLSREFSVSARVGKPQVAYRETVTAAGRGEHRYERQAGGHGEIAHVRLSVAPAERGAGVTIASRAEALPKAFAAAAELGIREAAARGVLAGYPVTDVAVTIEEATFHPVDSSERAFKVAGSQAFREAARAGRPVLLEPLVEVEVVCPDDCVGEVIGDLNARRGKIAGIEARLGVQVIASFVPLASMFGYATDIRSRTQGRATYSMQFKRYTEVPSSIGEAVAKATGA